MAVFNERVVSATEIGEEIDLDTPALHHHIRELRRMGCIELVETRRQRGAQRALLLQPTAIFDDVVNAIRDRHGVCSEGR